MDKVIFTDWLLTEAHQLFRREQTPDEFMLRAVQMIHALTEANKISANVPVSRSFHGRDEEDAQVIAEAKRIWTEEHQGKLKAVKYMIANGWGLKAAYDYCRENFG